MQERIIRRAKREMIERRVLVDRYTWSKVVYWAAEAGQRGTRKTAGEMLRMAVKDIHSKTGLW